MPPGAERTVGCATVIVVGDELLAPGARETHTDWLIGALDAVGVAVTGSLRVPDDAAAIADALRWSVGRSDAAVVAGGLGPTADDRTRDGLARFAGVPLEDDPEAFARQVAARGERGRPADDALRRQSRRPAGADWIANAVGTAPGLRLEHDGLRVIALPGVPSELRAMTEAHVLPRWGGAGRAAAAAARRRVYRVCGRGESDVDSALRGLFPAGSRVSVLIGAESIECHVRLAAEAVDPRSTFVALDAALRSALGDDLLDARDASPADAVARRLVEDGRRLATAESCTGGRIAGRLTDLAGASRWFVGGIVAYDNAVKRDRLGVDPVLLERHGAVSEPVVAAMAHGVRGVLDAEVGVAVSGVAGPDGGTATTPVGTVCAAVDVGGETTTVTWRLSGDREAVRARAVAYALDLVRRRLGTSERT